VVRLAVLQLRHGLAWLLVKRNVPHSIVGAVKTKSSMMAQIVTFARVSIISADCNIRSLVVRLAALHLRHGRAWLLHIYSCYYYQRNVAI